MNNDETLTNQVQGEFPSLAPDPKELLKQAEAEPEAIAKSKLAPYGAVILALSRKGFTCHQISDWLVRHKVGAATPEGEDPGTSPSNVHRFLESARANGGGKNRMLEKHNKGNAGKARPRFNAID